MIGRIVTDTISMYYYLQSNINWELMRQVLIVGFQEGLEV